MESPTPYTHPTGAPTGQCSPRGHQRRGAVLFPGPDTVPEPKRQFVGKGFRALSGMGDFGKGGIIEGGSSSCPQRGSGSYGRGLAPGGPGSARGGPRVCVGVVGHSPGPSSDHPRPGSGALLVFSGGGVREGHAEGRVIG